MMKTADARQGPRLAWFGRAWLNRPARRRRLLQAEDLRGDGRTTWGTFTSERTVPMTITRMTVLTNISMSEKP